MPKNKVTRRSVLQSGVAGVAAATVASPALGTLGANDKIIMAVAGLNGRGGSHVGNFAGMNDVQIAYLADPDKNTHGRRVNDVKNRGGNEPICVQDIRKVLEDKNVDAISIATPNHWHSLMTVWACQAGKHVYVEKPMSHNIFEGQQCIKAARKYKRVVQHGTQRRSEDKWWRAAAVIKSGKVGKLKIARGLCYKPGTPGGGNTRSDIGFRPVKPSPDHLDFNLWQGPAKGIEYHENLVHYRWHWFLETGNGDLGNQGAHQMDVARWMIPDGKLPKSMFAFGGRIGHYDQGNCASTHMAIMDYGDTKLIFETRGLPKAGGYRNVPGVGNILHCEAGDIIEGRWYPHDGGGKEAPMPEADYKMGPGGGNFRNFIEAVKTGKHTDLNADVVEGHYSAALCHLCNISYVLGNKVPFNPAHDVFEKDADAMDCYKRTIEHLEDNGINTAQSGYTLGRKLVIDQKTETFVNDRAANQMLTRDYRGDFVVPSEV